MQAETIQAVKRSDEALEACRLACRWLQPVSRDKTCIISKESLAQIVNGGSLRCGTARGCKVGSIERFPRKAEALCLVLQTAEPGFLYGCKFEDFWASQRSRRAFSPVRGPNTPRNNLQGWLQSAQQAAASGHNGHSAAKRGHWRDGQTLLVPTVVSHSTAPSFPVPRAVPHSSRAFLS